MTWAVKPWETESQPSVTHLPARHICLILFGRMVVPLELFINPDRIGSLSNASGPPNQGLPSRAAEGELPGGSLEIGTLLRLTIAVDVGIGGELPVLVREPRQIDEGNRNDFGERDGIGPALRDHCIDFVFRDTKRPGRQRAC